MRSLDWDDLRVFLAAARAGRLILAAQRLGLDHTTVARRIGSLEKAIGARLMERSPRGIALTAEGLELVSHAERMESAALTAQERLSGLDARLSGTVRLATPEAFGAYVVAPNIGMLLARHPGIELELVPESRHISLAKREADLAVGLNRPPRGRLIAQKLTNYSLGFYASQTYLDTHDCPKQVDDLRQHPLVWYIDELIDLPELRYLEEVLTDAKSIFRSSSIIAQQIAVSSGLGVGLLHSFAANKSPELTRLLTDTTNILRTYWIIVHADQHKLPRVRAVIHFLFDLIKSNPAFGHIQPPITANSCPG